MPKAGVTQESIIAALNTCMPAAAAAHLGTTLYALIAANTAVVADLATIKAKVNATLTKLDADAGVTDTTYSSLNAVGTLTAAAVALPETL